LSNLGGLSAAFLAHDSSALAATVTITVTFRRDRSRRQPVLIVGSGECRGPKSGARARPRGRRLVLGVAPMWHGIGATRRNWTELTGVPMRHKALRCGLSRGETELGGMSANGFDSRWRYQRNPVTTGFFRRWRHRGGHSVAIESQNGPVTAAGGSVGCSVRWPRPGARHPRAAPRRAGERRLTSSRWARRDRECQRSCVRRRQRRGASSRPYAACRVAASTRSPPFELGGWRKRVITRLSHTEPPKWRHASDPMQR
jgi:hypothetical protein